MKDFIESSFGIIIAFAFYAFFSKISFSLSQLINFFSLVVIYFAITKDEIHGAFIGTISGLIQDSFSLGVFGISGLAKTIIGFLAGFISHKINVIPFRRNFFFIFIMVSGEIVLSTFLYYFISAEYINEITPLILFQPLGTAFFGAFTFLLLRKFKRFTS